MRRLRILVGVFLVFPQVLPYGPGQHGLGRSPWGPCRGAIHVAEQLGAWPLDQTPNLTSQLWDFEQALGLPWPQLLHVQNQVTNNSILL